MGMCALSQRMSHRANLVKLRGHRIVISKACVLLWTLLASYTFSTIESYWELSHLVSNCESCQLLLQVLESGLEMQKS